MPINATSLHHSTPLESSSVKIHPLIIWFLGNNNDILIIHCHT